jgi:two-component system NtrC family sensor kinase
MPAETIAALEERVNAAGAGGENTAERVKALLELAYALREQEEWDRMLELTSEAIVLAEANGDSDSLARGLSLRAFVHYIRSDYQTALAECGDALRLAAGNIDTEGKARIVLAHVHWSLGNFEEALRQSKRASEMLRQSGDRITEAFCHALRGGVLHGLGDYSEALACHETSYGIFKEQNHAVGVARALSGIGSAWFQLGEREKALECHRQSLELTRDVDNGMGRSRALNDLGEFYESQGELDKAFDCHCEALEIRRCDGYRQAEVTSLMNLGKLHGKRGENDLALENLQQGLRIAEEIGARPKVCQLHQLLSEIYESGGRLQESLFHRKACQKAQRELWAEQSTLRHKALELEAQLESVQKDFEIHVLRNIELKQKNEELARLLEQLQATQAELVSTEKLAALGSLAAALAHEINSPLGVIRSSGDTTVRYIEKILNKGGESSGKFELDRAAFKTLQVNARLILDASKRIGSAVATLKSFAGIDQAEYAKLNLESALEEVLALVEPEFQSRIRILRQFQGVPSIYCFGPELKQVFMNLVRNAAEAIDSGGTIAVSTSLDDQNIRISVTDTGRGIPPDQLRRIFNPGFNQREGRVKAALGLFGCLSIVRKHGGDIQATSTPGEGSTFTVLMPRERAEARFESSYSR